METQPTGWAWLMGTDPVQHRIEKRLAGRQAKRDLFRVGHFTALFYQEIERLKRQYGGQVPGDAPELWDQTSAYITLSRKAAEEFRCQNIPGIRDSVYGKTSWDGAAMASTRAGRLQLTRARTAVSRAYEDAPARHAKRRRLQAAVDLLYAPEPRHDPRPTGGWRL